MDARATGFERSAIPANSWRAKTPGRVKGAALDALDRLVTSSRAHQDKPLPAEWFKYPPI